MKTELYFLEKKYKFTRSYLLFIKRIYNYLHLLEYFKTIRTETFNKMCDILKFYNNYSIDLIIDRKSL